MRSPTPEKDRSERYLITYADLMNLLLILFIVLFCTSSHDVVKTSAVMQAIKNGFTGGGQAAYSSSSTSSSSKSGSGNNAGTSNADDYSDFYNQLITLLNERNILDKVDITAKNNEVVISLRDNVLFAPGKADLNDDAVSLLTTMGNLIKNIKFGQLAIEGHTDSDPIHTAQFHDNRELSLARAYRVSKVFENCGLDPKKILPVGYGEYFPVAPNTTVENKAKNRRVVISILKKGITPADETISTEDIKKLNSSSFATSSTASSSGASSSSSSVTSSSTSSAASSGE